MRHVLRAAAGAAAGVLVITSCATGRAPAPPVPRLTRGVAQAVPAADPRPYGAADTEFGLDVLGAWCRADRQSNLLLSPSSLASGLGMAYLGARGATARAMARVLHLPAASGTQLAAGLRARAAALRGLGGAGVQLAASDQVWADPALPPLPSYLNAVATGYDAGVARVPLLRQPGQAARQINQAIAAATRGHIRQLLSPGSLHDIGWVLTDALFLRAAWTSPFLPSETSPGEFTTAAGQRVSVKFMNGAGYRTATAGGWSAVSLPYRGGALTMTALLPPASAGSCATPSPAALGGLTARLARGGAAAGVSTQAIALPRVGLRTRADMKSLLGTLGMGSSFTQSADFTGLSPRACCIGLIIHAATLQVGEKGTVASAATAAGIAPTAAYAGHARVAFDRPYLLLVSATRTGEPLFLARVANPAAP